MNGYSILLFSKFSIHSKKLIDMMAQSRLNFKEKANLTPVCVDSKAIRDKIKNNKLNIRYVPCILTVYPNGVVEKYDGENAFNWVQDVVKSFTQPLPPPIPAPSFEKSPKILETVKQQQEDEDDNDEEEEDHRPRVEPKVILKKKRGQKKKVTRLDDLEDLEDEEEQADLDWQTRKINKKKKMILKDRGNYEAADDEDEHEEFMDDRIVDQTKTDRAINKSSSSTLLKAKELAKMRENDIASSSVSVNPRLGA